VKGSEQEIVKDSRELRLSFHLSDARNMYSAVKYRGNKLHIVTCIDHYYLSAIVILCSVAFISEHKIHLVCMFLYIVACFRSERCLRADNVTSS